MKRTMFAIAVIALAATVLQTVRRTSLAAGLPVSLHLAETKIFRLEPLP
jgi:hypothetical protein